MHQVVLVSDRSQLGNSTNTRWFGSLAMGDNFTLTFPDLGTAPLPLNCEGVSPPQNQLHTTTTNVARLLHRFSYVPERGPSDLTAGF